MSNNSIKYLSSQSNTGTQQWIQWVTDVPPFKSIQWLQNDWRSGSKPQYSMDTVLKEILKLKVWWILCCIDLHSHATLFCFQSLETFDAKTLLDLGTYLSSSIGTVKYREWAAQ